MLSQDDVLVASVCANLRSTLVLNMWSTLVLACKSTGFISNGELFQVLKLMVGSNLKDMQVRVKGVNTNRR